MANSKIICTVVPNGKSGNKLFFSVFLSPRLMDDENLDKFENILNWPKYLEFFRNNKNLTVKFGKLDTPAEAGGKYTVTPADFSLPIDYEDKENISSTISNFWSELFHDNTPVEKWDPNQGIQGAKIAPIIDPGRVIKKAGFAGSSASFASLSLEDQKELVDTSGVADTAGVTESEKNIQKKDQEFHDKMSALSEYPHLLRIMGWLFDFSYIITEETDISGYNLIKLVVGKEFERKNTNTSSEEVALYKEFVKRIDFITPWSYFDPQTFSIKYMNGLPYFGVQEGFIKPKIDSQYQIQALQLDFKQIIKDYKINEGQSVEEKDDTPNSETGIGLIVFANETSSTPLVSAINNHPENTYDEKIVYADGVKEEFEKESNYVLFGHHLDTGYWIDVVEIKEKRNENHIYSENLGEINFKSLCQRVSDYVVEQKIGTRKTILENHQDEPWIAESAQVGKSGTKYYDLELCRWNNWSLTCPHIGNYPQDEEEIKDEFFNDLELTNTIPLQKSLLPMRFGKWYGFRIRVADICGNGKSLNASLPKNGSGQIDTSFIINTVDPYQRCELVNPPSLFFTKNKKDEQSLDTLVVKSKVLNNRLNFDGDCLRIVSPPESNFQFIEIHGIFDELLNKKNNNKDNYLEEIRDKASFIPIDNEPSEEIPYLTDPCANGYKVTVEDFTNLNAEVKLAYWGTKGEAYLNRKFSSVTLKGENTFESIKENNESIQLAIKPGSIYDVVLHTVVHQNPANFQPIDPSKSKADFSIFHPKVQEKLTSDKRIKVIHAVQKPVVQRKQSYEVLFSEQFVLHGKIKERELLPEFDPKTLIPIVFSELSFGLPKFNNSSQATPCFPVATSSEFRLIAEYEDLIVDFSKAKGYYLEKRIMQTSFSNLLELNSETEVEEGATEIPKDTKKKINPNDLKFEDEYDNDGGFLGEFDQFNHSFGDTKYRSVKYKIEAVSRFQEYFSEGEEVSIEGLINDAAPIIVKSSGIPDAPVIQSIVPVFDWKEGNNSAERKQHTFRIYFDGDWYSSGMGEKLAVLFIENETTIDETHEGIISEYGKDPSTATQPTKGLNRNIFLTEEIIGAKNEETIYYQLLGKEKFSEVLEVPEKKIWAAIYDVEFEKTESSIGKFYCDIKLNLAMESNKYFPFLKLAVCRYQPFSIYKQGHYDYRFSSVVTAPQVQILPNRKISWDEKFTKIKIDSNQPTKEGNEFYAFYEKEFESNSSRSISKIIKQSLNNIIDTSTVNVNSYNILTVEEYETYVAGPADFNVVEDDNYNPRNDIRKRLVFSYQIKLKKENRPPESEESESHDDSNYPEGAEPILSGGARIPGTAFANLEDITLEDSVFTETDVIVEYDLDSTKKAKNKKGLGFARSEKNYEIVDISQEKHPWDSAYEEYFKRKKANEPIAYVEPNAKSQYLKKIDKDTTVGFESSASNDYISNWPFPEVDSFNWHLDDDHSQLIKAYQKVKGKIQNERIRIAHIDTGYVKAHPSTPKYILKDLGESFVKDEYGKNKGEDRLNTGFPAEKDFHGCATMAILAGNEIDQNISYGNFKGEMGGIPMAEVIPIRICETVFNFFNANDVARAIEYAIEKKCEVITMSMAGYPTKRVAKAVNEAYKKGIVIVTAAGNCWGKGIMRISPKALLYPARFERVIAATGACYNDKPYDFEANSNFYIEGGDTMQGNWGPPSAMKTAIAAYTPNIAWAKFDKDMNPIFSKSGGGTSSSTPQIAAAAALWLLYHRRELSNDLFKQEPWRKVEAVRKALFNSASKAYPKYKQYYGHGILRAYYALDAFDFKNSNKLKKSEEANVRFGGIFQFLSGWFRKRAQRDAGFAPYEEDKILLEMLSQEIIQILYRDPNLYDYAEEINFESEEDSKFLDNPEASASFLSKLKESKYASSFLKDTLTN